MKPIMAAIEAGAATLLEARLAVDASPAFLMIRSEAGTGERWCPVGLIIGRSFSRLTFRRATFLKSKGIERVVVVRRKRLEDDLVEVLQDLAQGRPGVT